MRKMFVGFWGAAFLLFFFTGIGMAQHGHDQGKSPAAPAQKSSSQEGSKGKESLQSETVEGLKVTFQVMKMEEHMKHTAQGSSHRDADHARSHSLMVTLQDLASKEIISDARVAYTLSAPSGGKEKGKLTWSGDHYSGAANLKEKGTYRAQLAIESGGMERQANFEYQAK